MSDLRWIVSELDRHVCSRALGATRYRSPQAVHMLAAIALQESWCNALFQRGRDGLPIRTLARSPWQLELAGVRAIAGHDGARAVLEELEPGLSWRLRYNPEQVWERSAWDVVLACRLARALLWTEPEALPRPVPADEERAWRQYLRTWRPGRPDRERWHRVWTAILPRRTPT